MQCSFRIYFLSSFFIKTVAEGLKEELACNIKLTRNIRSVASGWWSSTWIQDSHQVSSTIRNRYDPFIASSFLHFICVSSSPFHLISSFPFEGTKLLFFTHSFLRTFCTEMWFSLSFLFPPDSFFPILLIWVPLAEDSGSNTGGSFSCQLRGCLFYIPSLFSFSSNIYFLLFSRLIFISRWSPVIFFSFYHLSPISITISSTIRILILIIFIQSVPRSLLWTLTVILLLALFSQHE